MLFCDTIYLKPLKNKPSRGFTLLELVVVISILAILSATAIPRFVNLQQEARVSSLKGLAGALASGIELVQSRFNADMASGLAVGGIPGMSCLPDPDDFFIGNGNGGGVLVGGNVCVDVVFAPSPTYETQTNSIPVPTPVSSGIGKLVPLSTNYQAVYFDINTLSPNAPYTYYDADGTSHSFSSNFTYAAADPMVFFTLASEPTPTMDTQCQVVYLPVTAEVLVSVYSSTSTNSNPAFGC